MNFIRKGFAAVIILGLCVLSYPLVSQKWNEQHQTKAVIAYEKQSQDLDAERKRACLEKARIYNQALYRGRIDPGSRSGKKQYQETLNLGADGMMGSIQIPSIHVRLPMYHGTDEKVLQSGIGHLQDTSLPVGGENTHCVLSGHSGLPQARLFTDLEQVEKGEYFILEVLGEKLVYQVDEINVVLPEETELLNIHEGRDECTLVTCTPYGINSHRLLVHGTRVENAEVIPGAEGKDSRNMAWYLLILCLFLELELVEEYRRKRMKR